MWAPFFFCSFLSILLLLKPHNWYATDSYHGTNAKRNVGTSSDSSKLTSSVTGWTKTICSTPRPGGGWTTRSWSWRASTTGTPSKDVPGARSVPREQTGKTFCAGISEWLPGTEKSDDPKHKEQECTKRNTTITLPHLSRGLKHTWPICSVYSVALLNSIKIKSGKALLYIYSSVCVGRFTTVALANLKRKSNSCENSGVAVAHWGWNTCLASTWHKPCLSTRRGGFVKDRISVLVQSL